jgi:hypothetical protein
MSPCLHSRPGGAFAGGEVAGVAGTFLSVPALARVIYLRLRKARLAVRLGPTSTATP